MAKRPNPRLKEIWKRLGPEFDGFIPRGKFLVHSSIEFVVAGFGFDATDAFGQDMRWLEAFLSPVFTPRLIAYSYGHRLNYHPGYLMPHWPVRVSGSPESEINETIEIMRRIGLPYLEGRSTTEGFYEMLLCRGWEDEATFGQDTLLGPGALHWAEDKLRCSIVLGRFKDAKVHLDEALEQVLLQRAKDRDREWPVPAWQLDQYQRIENLGANPTISHFRVRREMLFSEREAILRELALDDLAANMT